MKELSIEQKAKRFDEVLAIAKECITYVPDDAVNKYMLNMFPELKESEDEDEKIRKELIELIGCMHDADPRKKGWLAWLEKQGEQNPADKVEPKFHKGDWVVVSTTKGEKVVQIASVEYLKGGYPSYITTEGRWFGNGTKARLLTDKDVKTITLPESKVIVKQKTDGWSEEDEKMLGKCIDAASGYYDPKEKDSMKSWLESLRPRTEMIEALRTEYEKGRADALSEMKSSWDEWDEDDIYMLEQAIKCVNNSEKLEVSTEDIEEWLKALGIRMTNKQ